jgi:hypothetical protein
VALDRRPRAPVEKRGLPLGIDKFGERACLIKPFAPHIKRLCDPRVVRQLVENAPLSIELLGEEASGDLDAGCGSGSDGLLAPETRVTAYRARRRQDAAIPVDVHVGDAEIGEPSDRFERDESFVAEYDEP